MPRAARNRTGLGVLGLLADAAVARSARRRSVLPVSVDVVGNLVVGGDVVHLPDRQLHVVPALAAVHRHAQAVVVRDDHAVAVHGIDPHVVVVAARRDLARQVDARLAAVERLREFRCEEVRLVLVVGRDREARVVVRATAKPPIGAHHLPVLAAVLAAPERSALRCSTVVGRHAVAGFDEGVDAIRIRARHLRRDLAERRAGESVFRQPRPRRAAVCRSKQPAA